jgi:hypothetical protein
MHVRCSGFLLCEHVFWLISHMLGLMLISMSLPMLLIHYNESVQLTKVALYKYMCSASRISVFSCLWYRW